MAWDGLSFAAGAAVGAVAGAGAMYMYMAPESEEALEGASSTSEENKGPQAPTQGAPTAPTHTFQYVDLEGVVSGEIPQSMLPRLVKVGEVTPMTLVWERSMSGGFQPAGTVPAIRGLFDTKKEEKKA